MAAGHIRRLPRSGEWLAWIEQLFGFVLVGLALYFLDPLVPDRSSTRMLPYYAVAAGIFLGFISPAGRNWRPFLVIRYAIGAFSIVALIVMSGAESLHRAATRVRSLSIRRWLRQQSPRESRS